MPAQHLDQARLEPLPLGDSQLHPEFQYRQPEFLSPVEDSHFEPAITVLSMSLQWERLLAYEKRRNRQLISSMSWLQAQLQQAEQGYKTLKQQYDRLCNGTDADHQPEWGPQDAQKTPTGPQFSNGHPDVSAANNLHGSMLPPPSQPKEDVSQGTKRKIEITGGAVKRIATRNLVLNPYDRPLSPKSTYSPQTPTSMKF